MATASNSLTARWMPKSKRVSCHTMYLIPHQYHLLTKTPPRTRRRSRWPLLQSLQSRLQPTGLQRPRSIRAHQALHRGTRSIRRCDRLLTRRGTRSFTYNPPSQDAPGRAAAVPRGSVHLRRSTVGELWAAADCAAAGHISDYDPDGEYRRQGRSPVPRECEAV